MARFSHKNAYIEFASINFSGQSNACELTVDVDISEITAFSEAAKEYVEDIYTWSIAVAGFTDQDAGNVEDTLQVAVGTGEQTIDYRPQGAATGYKLDGMAILKGYAVGGAMIGGCAYSATFQGNGALTRSAL